MLATRGAVLVHADRFPEAVSTIGSVLGGFKLSTRVEFSVAGNLAHAVSESDDHKGLERAQAQLRRARQLAGPRSSVQKSTFYWIEGRVAGKPNQGLAVVCRTCKKNGFPLCN